MTARPAAPNAILSAEHTEPVEILTVEEVAEFRGILVADLVASHEALRARVSELEAANMELRSGRTPREDRLDDRMSAARHVSHGGER